MNLNLSSKFSSLCSRLYLIGRRIRNRFVMHCDPSQQSGFNADNQCLLECKKENLSIFVIRKLVPIVRTQPFPLDELLLIAASTVFFRPQLIIDWGTHVGTSARVFYETCRWYGIDAEIHSVDLPRDVYHPQHPEEKYALLLHGTSVNLHRGDGATVAVRLIKESGDVSPLCMLDGDHSYKTISRELNTISEAAPSAAILVHDTFHQLDARRGQSGAYRAVEDFISSNSRCRQVISCEIGPPGLTLIKLDQGGEHGKL